jgi:hypothetical protein
MHNCISILLQTINKQNDQYKDIHTAEIQFMLWKKLQASLKTCHTKTKILKNKHAANLNRCTYIYAIEKARHSRRAPAIKYAGDNV